MTTTFDELLRFCVALHERRARYCVRAGRADSMMVSVAVPGEYWEIEFFEDGTLEVERFMSQGVEDRPTAVEDVLRYFDD